MVESLLRSLKKDEALQGPLSARILDQGDAVGAWTAPRLAAILFPTPETLKQACVDPLYTRFYCGATFVTFLNLCMKGAPLCSSRHGPYLSEYLLWRR